MRIPPFREIKSYWAGTVHPDTEIFQKHHLTDAQDRDDVKNDLPVQGIEYEKDINNI